jgi:DNA-binding NarL/FixJ family response regulator
MSAIRIAIVDDHQIIIDGLVSLLHETDIEVVHSTTSPVNMLETLANIKADVLLTDIMMPEMTGQELARQVRTQFPHIRILALSMSGQEDIINEMIRDADIAGYLLKNIDRQELSYAIHTVASGKLYFSTEVLQALDRTLQIQKENADTHLTRREIEIIALIEKEMSNKDIAEKLFISERTVETHRKNIFRKTKTNSVLGLIKYAYEHKLI